jgi:hypothetical protein
MGAAANIVLTDSSTVDHTFNPVEVSPANSLYLARVGNTPQGNEALRLLFSRATSGRATNRVTLHLDKPYEQEVDGVYTVYDTARFKGTWTLPDTMTLAQREIFASLVIASINNAVLTTAVEELESVW